MCVSGEVWICEPSLCTRGDLAAKRGRGRGDGGKMKGGGGGEREGLK